MVGHPTPATSLVARDSVVPVARPSSGLISVWTPVIDQAATPLRSAHEAAVYGDLGAAVNLLDDLRQGVERAAAVVDLATAVVDR